MSATRDTMLGYVNRYLRDNGVTHFKLRHIYHYFRSLNMIDVNVEEAIESYWVEKLSDVIRNEEFPEGHPDEGARQFICVRDPESVDFIWSHMDNADGHFRYTAGYELYESGSKRVKKSNLTIGALNRRQRIDGQREIPFI